MDEHEQLLESLRREEESLQFGEFTNDIAFDLGTRFVDVARQRGLPITVDIARSGQQLFHCAMPGTAADNDAWVQRKNRVVMRFGHSSYYMGISCKSQSTTLEERYFLDPAVYAAHGGAFPITIRNVGVVGTVTVSGLPQEEDHKLVVSTLREFLGVDL